MRPGSNHLNRENCFSAFSLVLSVCLAAVLASFPAAAADKRVATVVADSANLREEPSFDAKSVGWVSKGAVLPVIDEFTEVSGKKWYKVRTSEGKRLWLADKVVKVTTQKKAEVREQAPKNELPSGPAVKNVQKQQSASGKSTEANAVKKEVKTVVDNKGPDDEKTLLELLEKADRFFKEGKCEDFIKANLDAISIVRKRNDLPTEGKIHYNVSECFTRLKRYGETIEHLDAAVSIGNKTGNAEIEILAMIDKSRVLVIQGDKKAASEILKAASEKADREIFLDAAAGDYLKALISFQTAGVLFSLGEKEKAREKLDFSLTLNSDLKQEEDIIELMKSVDPKMHEQLSAVNKDLDAAWSSYEKGDYRNMAKISLKTLETAKKLSYKRGVFGCNYYIAMSSIGLEKYDDAVDYALRAQEIAERGNDRTRLGMVYNLTGNIFKQKKAYDKALYYYGKNLDIARKTGNSEGEAVTMSNIGNVLMDKSEYKDALKYFEDSLKVGSEAGLEKYFISQGNLSVGIARKKTGDYAGAEKSIVTAIGLFRELGNAGGELVCIWELAGNYALKGEYGAAVKILEENLDRAEKLGLKRSFVDDLINYAEKNKDYLKAEKYRKKS